MESSLEVSFSSSCAVSGASGCLPPARSRIFKIIVIGDSNVGKTCLTYRFCAGRFPDRTEATIGVDFRERAVEIDGERIKVSRWRGWVGGCHCGGLCRYLDRTVALCRSVRPVCCHAGVQSAFVSSKLLRHCSHTPNVHQFYLGHLVFQKSTYDLVSSQMTHMQRVCGPHFGCQ